MIRKDETLPKKTRYQATIHIPAGYAFQGDSATGMRKHDKVYPNDPCPCGSTIKAKKCCFKNSKVTPSRKTVAMNPSAKADGKE